MGPVAVVLLRRRVLLLRLLDPHPFQALAFPSGQLLRGWNHSNC